MSPEENKVESAPAVETPVVATPVEEKDGISNEEFLQADPKTFSEARCSKCNGAGLARPEFAGSEYCSRCMGTGLEPIK